VQDRLAWGLEQKEKAAAALLSLAPEEGGEEEAAEGAPNRRVLDRLLFLSEANLERLKLTKDRRLRFEC
jgi:hypothetical protein